MVEVKTKELIGAALDWAVWLADRGRPGDFNLKTGLIWTVFGDHWSPSTDWSQGGPLRDKYKVAVYDVERGMIAASLRGNEPEMWIDEGEFEADAIGATALIAVCRAIVAAKLGDTVQVPDELVQEARA